MLTMKDTGLVNGVPLEGTPQLQFKVLKGFYDEQHIERRSGEIVTMSERFSRPLLQQGRIEPYIVVEVQQVVAPPVEPEPVQEEEPRHRRGRRFTSED